MSSSTHTVSSLRFCTPGAFFQRNLTEKSKSVSNFIDMCFVCFTKVENSPEPTPTVETGNEVFRTLVLCFP